MKRMQTIDTLPTNVRMALFSETGNKIDIEIFDNFLLWGAMSEYNGLLKRLFLKELSLESLPAVLEKEFMLLPEKALELVLAIVGRRLLCVDDWIGGAKDFIKKHGGNLGAYDKDVAAYKKENLDFSASMTVRDLKEDKIIKEYEALVAKAKQEAVDEEESALTPAQEQKEILSLLKNNLADVIIDTDDKQRLLLNYKLIHYITQTETKDFWNAVLDMIKVCAQPLTAETIIIDNKQVDPTIGHWIESFTKSVGMENLDPLHKSQYLATSPNTKNLSAEERKYVSDLLDAYMALKTFPRNFINTPPELWQIFPVSQKEAEKLEKYKHPEKSKLPKEKLALQKAISDKPIQVELLDDEIIARYLGSKGEQQLLEMAEAEIQSKFAHDTRVIADFVKKNTVDRTADSAPAESIHAALRVLAKSKSLQSVLPQGLQIGAYLHHILREVLGYPEDDAARYALQILNQADISPENIVHYDESENIFKFD